MTILAELTTVFLELKAGEAKKKMTLQVKLSRGPPYYR